MFHYCSKLLLQGNPILHRPLMSQFCKSSSKHSFRQSNSMRWWGTKLRKTFFCHLSSLHGLECLTEKTEFGRTVSSIKGQIKKTPVYLIWCTVYHTRSIKWIRWFHSSTKLHLHLRLSHTFKPGTLHFFRLQHNIKIMRASLRNISLNLN